MLFLITIVLYYFFVITAGQLSYIEIISSQVGVRETPKKLTRTKYISNDHPCKRNCQPGSPAMLCKYNFDIDWYYTLTQDCGNCPYNISNCFRKDCVPGDGTRRGIVSINKMLPGPSIEVCLSDIIIVDVNNKMLSEPTTIHWHGQPQRATPFMDGVPFITQCPILPGNSFRYTFKASQAGTHFWHSHIGMQRVNGAFGPLIVRIPKDEDNHKRLYDYDLPSHVMVINDWDSQDGDNVLLNHFYGGGSTSPPNLLVNGIGRFRKFLNGKEEIFIPTARFKVDKGYRYRFRLINAGSLNCPIEVSVDSHLMKVISADGLDIKPITAKSIITYSGERFDFIIHANQAEDLYWIKFKGLMNCKEKEAFQVAVLEYNKIFNEPLSNYPGGTVNYENAHNQGILMNPLNKGTSESDDSVVPVTRMKSVESWDGSLKPKPDFQYFIGFDFYNISNNQLYPDPTRDFQDRILTPQFNHISMLQPTVNLNGQRNELKGDVFCNKETLKGKDCTKVHCQCLHGIKVPLGSVVELVFVDEGFSYDVNHPLHLHGYHFRVVAMERVGTSVTVEEVKRRDTLGQIERNLVDAPFKDTVTVPDGGYTIVRFEANSPGYWVLHCHIDVHMALGMAMILQVGEENEMVTVPENFPKCGDFVPDLTHLFSSINDEGQLVQYNAILFSLTFLVISLYSY